MNPKILLLIVMAVAQLGIPAQMIYQHEKVLETGAVYKFKTAPVDPYDALRGRYVALSVDQRSVPLEDFGGTVDQIRYGDKAYALLTQDNEGFARLDKLMLTPPDTGDYIVVRLRGMYEDRINLDLPFDRYYMNEYKAPRAEQLYREQSMPGSSNAYIEVRVLNGRTAIENLFIDGKPVEQLFDD